MPNDGKKPKASRGLSSYFQPAIDTVAAMDPTGVLLNLLSGVKSAPPAPQPTLQQDDFNFIPKSPELIDPMTEMMNRQGKIKQTFGKIPGR